MCTGREDHHTQSSCKVFAAREVGEAAVAANGVPTTHMEEGEAHSASRGVVGSDG